MKKLDLLKKLLKSKKSAVAVIAILLATFGDYAVFCDSDYKKGEVKITIQSPALSMLCNIAINTDSEKGSKKTTK